jgi:hypothetical protein
MAIAISVFSSSHAFAGAPTFSDARALAMGGVGVTAARPAAAGFFNPALLAVKQPDKRDGFGMLLPSVSVIANDEDELRDVADNFEDDFITPFENSINALEASIGGSNQTAEQEDLVKKTQALNKELQSIDQDQARVDLGLGFSALIPNQTFGAGLFVSGSARIAGQVNYKDQQALDALEQLLQTPISSIDQVYDLYNVLDDDEQLQSSVRAVGSAYSQVGVAMSHNFRFDGHDYALGVSPKMVDLRAYDFTTSAGNAEVDDLTDTKVSESKFNFDIGVASFVDARERILVGFSLINVLPMKITTDPGYANLDDTDPDFLPPSAIEIDIKPKATAGVSYRGDSYEVATDLELNKTEEFFGEGDTQYWGLGAEYDLFEAFQVRGGMRYNIAESEGVVFTAGFGLSVVGVTFELAALSDTDSNTVGVGTQLGVTF